jgi:hypothetical protein
MSDTRITPLPPYESDLVRRYVRGELDEDDTARFERSLLGSTDLQDVVEAELALHDHADALPIPKRSLRAGEWTRHWGLAASLLVGIGMGWLLTSGLQSTRDSLDAGAVATVSFAALRGDASLRFQAPAGVPIVARFVTADDVPHRLQVRDHSGAVRIELPDLMPDDEGYLNVVLPAFPYKIGPLNIDLESPQRKDHFVLELLPAGER